MKKVISIMLLVCVVCMSLSFTAFAESFESEENMVTGDTLDVNWSASLGSSAKKVVTAIHEEIDGVDRLTVTMKKTGSASAAYIHDRVAGADYSKIGMIHTYETKIKLAKTGDDLNSDLFFSFRRHSTTNNDKWDGNEILRFMHDGTIGIKGDSKGTAESVEIIDDVTYKYDTWYIIKFNTIRIDKSNALISITIDEVGENGEYTQLCEIPAFSCKAPSTVDTIRYVFGVAGGAEGDVTTVDIEYLKVTHSNPFDISFYNGEVSEENLIDTLVEGDITASVNFLNADWFNEALTPTQSNSIMLARYSDNKLADIDIFNADSENLSKEYVFEDVVAGDTIKCFTWKDLTELSPIINAITFDAYGYTFN